MAETMNRKVPAHSGARGGAGTGSPADFQAVAKRGDDEERQSLDPAGGLG
jgi:hypothetical protein